MPDNGDEPRPSSEELIRRAKEGLDTPAAKSPFDEADAPPATGGQPRDPAPEVPPRPDPPTDPRVVTPYPPTEPPTKSRRGLVIGLVVLAIVLTGVGLLAISTILSRSDDTAAEPPATVQPGGGDDAAPTPTAAQGTSTTFDDLELGDCWNSDNVDLTSPDLVELFAVGVVPCDEPHFAEVYSKHDLQGGASAPYPGPLETELESLHLCLDQFETEFGISYESSPLDIYPVFPLEASWSFGDRETICSASTFDGTLLVGRATEVPALPGEDLDVLDAQSCDELVDMMVINAQDVIVAFEVMSTDVLDNLGPTDIAPGTERPIKRDVLMTLILEDLGCTLAGLNESFATRTGELEASTFLGESILESFAVDGYWDEAFFD